MQCRFCKKELTNVFIDLVNAPASNSFLRKEQLDEPETFYPLRVYTCSNCFLVQVDEYKKSAAIFNNDYVYFSSYSTSWLKHARDYTSMMVERFGLESKSQVIELASNDGYLLQYFKERDIPVLGIEPTANTAKVAIDKGISTIIDFFGVRLAKELVKKNIKADLLLGNNVLAHVPDIVDFVRGMKIILSDKGIITMEFPHLMQLVNHNQFDTIYHEHFSYLSFHTTKKIFEACGLDLFDVEEIPTHGGSLRIFAKHVEDFNKEISPRVDALIQKELKNGMNSLAYYDNFQEKVLRAKIDLLEFLIQKKRGNKKVAAYGAAAKGNTLLNYCGIKNDLISFVVDANPHKQNRFLPLPWNLKEEIMDQISYIRNWNGQFVIPIPELQIF
jgi:hypothetical protein